MELRAQKVWLQDQFRKLAERDVNNEPSAQRNLSLAMVCAALADNARMRCDARDAEIRDATLHEYGVRYGVGWVQSNTAQVRADAGVRISKDPIFKEAASANEMYGRWSVMYSQLATAMNSAKLNRELHNILRALDESTPKT